MKIILICFISILSVSCASKKNPRVTDGTELGFEKRYSFNNGSYFLLQSIVPWKDELVVTGLLINRSDRPKFFEPETFSIVIDSEEVEPKKSTASGLIDYHQVKKAQFFYPRKDCAIVERTLGRQDLRFRATFIRHAVTGVVIPETTLSDTGK